MYILSIFIARLTEQPVPVYVGVLAVNPFSTAIAGSEQARVAIGAIRIAIVVIVYSVVRFHPCTAMVTSRPVF
ncbi:MAG: hypothetical protein QXI19_03090 [Candidatus Caldarchaeum sp.]